jgi:hypothetical protein
MYSVSCVLCSVFSQYDTTGKICTSREWHTGKDQIFHVLDNIQQDCSLAILTFEARKPYFSETESNCYPTNPNSINILRIQVIL